jgi:probable HAF family extracellular repeat protein
MQDLGPGAGLSSAAHSINDYGQVAGLDFRYAPDGTPNGYDAVVWDGAGGFQVYGPLAGDDSTVAEAINNSGQVVGNSRIFNRLPDEIDRPVMWNSAGGIHSLGPLPGGNGHGYANAINDIGQIAGTASAPGGSHAFRWTSEGGMQNLGDLPGGSNFSLGRGIGSSGAVVGSSITSGGSHAFIWRSNTGMQDLGDLPGDNRSIALDVNSNEVVVGNSGTTSGQFGLHAFIWTSVSGMMDLNSMLDPSSAGWSLTSAESINDAGQIAGWGISPSGAWHAFLLTPIPEPSTVLLVVSMLPTLTIRRRA